MANLTPPRDTPTYDQLVEALRRQLPPEDSDHNASDVGIMLLELVCWFGEMASYRMERVPEPHQAKFVKFLIEPPEPVTVRVTFDATFQPAPGTASVTIPAGTLLATGFDMGRRVVFETFQPVTLDRPALPAAPQAKRTVRARAILEVVGEALGVSDGQPNQTFALRPPRVALRITDPDAPTPILTDYVHQSGTYEPNPRVTVGGVAWATVPSLRSEGSRVSPPLNLAEHCMVESFDSQVRFGDAVFGAIPPAGSVIACTRYAVLDGPEALTVGQDQVQHLLNFTPPTDVTLTLGNTPAEGGAHFYPMSRRTELGLREFRAPYRLITAADFERAVLTDFNAFQTLSLSTPEILRASAAFNVRPESQPDGSILMLDAPGHVTLILIAGAPHFDETQFRDELVLVATKQAMLDVPDVLWQRLRRFLDPRRLITTRLNRTTPRLVPITMTATVAVAAVRNLVSLQAELRERVYTFFSLLEGDFDGRGWRVGRSVYRSQVFRLLEEADGVDHVASVSFSPADGDGNVPIRPQELPLLQTLTLLVERA